MTVCTTEAIEFTRCKRRKVVADFSGGEITSDAGVLLLSEADKRLRLTQRIAPQFDDPRCKGKCDHSLQDMLRQRIYALALGYEDLNDHMTLRKDTALQTAVGRDTDLASNATLCRFENRATRQMCWQISEQLVEVFIESHATPPQPLINEAQSGFDASGQKKRLFADLVYAAESWRDARRIIAKAEHSRKGANPRFVATSLSGDARALYEQLYCARGEAENRIKEQQLDLFADRTSCMNWLPNQLRVLLSGLAYTLMEAVRRLALTGTKLARACCGTIRLKLLKIGAVIVRNTRRVHLMLSSACPYQELFIRTANRLRAP